MSEQKAVQCPVCGASNVEISNESRSYSAPFGVPISFAVELATCRTCGESGDFRNANAAVLKQAIETADQRSLGSILEWLGEVGISMAFVERALRLPTRTVARWKAGECSASGIALLRLVRRYPWLLEVAAAGFSEVAARKAVLAAAGAVVAEAVDAAGLQYSVSASRPEAGMVELTARFEPKARDVSAAPNFVELPLAA
jgi:hypothetical protein